MNYNVFREYDIRGVVKEDFYPEFVYNLGRAYGTVLNSVNQKNVSISGDIRKTTVTLKENLILGLLNSGINVYDLGTIPTPVNYFSLFETDIPNSVQITGSHNPPEYNGFKFSLAKKPFFGKEIQNVKAIMIENKYSNSLHKGSLFKLDVIEDYIKLLKEKIKIDKALSTIMDCGNATGGIVAPEIFRQLGINNQELYCDIDDTFPNHHPDPTVDKNLNDLVQLVDSNNVDFGLAYDGDADRVVIVDDKARIIRSDILMSIFVSDIVNPNDTIIYDVKCSRSLHETILQYKGCPIMYKTGHSLIKNKMLETKSKFGGEMSGHLFFADKYYGYDDGIYASLRVAELLSRLKDVSLSSLVDEIPQYFSSQELRLNCNTDKEKFDITNKTIEYFSSKYDCNLIDGVRVEFEDGWGLVRASNTQPVIVCRFEANNQSMLNEIQTKVLSKLKEFGDIEIEL